MSGIARSGGRRFGIVHDAYPGDPVGSDGWFPDTSPLKITLLGGFEISRGRRTIDATGWPRRKASQIIKILACHPERRVHREQLFTYLWPELNLYAAANNFRVTLHSARAVLKSHLGLNDDLVAIHGEMVELADPDRVTIDAREFECAADVALGTTNPVLYQQAVALYSGELLPEDRFEEWSFSLRSRVDATYATLLGGLAALHERAGELDTARTLLRDLLVLDPLCEDAHASLMRIEASAGRRSAAIRQFEDLRRLLREQVQAEPDASTQSLYEQILDGAVRCRYDANAGVTPSRLLAPGDSGHSGTSLHNLPASTSRFVGRARESGELQSALSQSRMVTVTGPGGVGKTRLSLSVAEHLVGAIPGGVWLIELESLADPDLVVRAIASALMIREDPWETLLDRLVERLQVRSVLLIFDNCEHLVRAVSGLIDELLRRCPGVRVLATSREVIGVAGERVLRLLPMMVPDATSTLNAVSLRNNDAIELFVEKARERNVRFCPSDDEVSTIAEICRVLEGMPLSITLSAAWTAMLPVEQIARRLDSSLGFLTNGQRTAPARHRTIRATVYWSYGLLNQPERFVMRRTGVFRDGFTLEALEHLCSPECHGEFRVEDVVSGLIDKSLILVDRHGSASRYRTMSVVREYASEQLEQSEELDILRERYRNWYIHLVDDAEPGLVGSESSEWMDRLLPEIHNLRAILHWSLEQGDHATVLHVAGALWGFWHLSGRIGEGRGWIEPLLHSPLLEDVPELVRVRALHAAGFLAQRQGEYRRATEWTELCLEQARASSDQRGMNYALNNLCLCSLYRGEIDRAIELAIESLNLSHSTGIEPATPSSLSSIGLAEFWRGNLDEAWEYLEAAVIAAREIRFPAFESWLLGQLADVARARSDFARARTYANRSIELGRSAGDLYGPALGERVHGRLALDMGDCADAAAYLSNSLETFQSLGYKLRVIECLEDLGELAERVNDPARAVRLLATARRLRIREECPLPMTRSSSINEISGRLRRTLSAASFDAATAAGQALTLEQAIRDALSTDLDNYM